MIANISLSIDLAQRVQLLLNQSSTMVRKMAVKLSRLLTPDCRYLRTS